MKRSKLVVASSAAFGGIAPNLLALAIGLQGGGKGVPSSHEWATYSLALLIFAVMAAAVALLWRETNLKKAFFLGMGLPALIHVAGDSLQPGGDVASSQASVVSEAFALIPRAYAQPVDVAVAGRTLRLEVVGQVPRGFSVLFSSRSGRRSERRGLDAAQPVETVAVPDYASDISITAGSSVSERIAVSELPNSSTKARVTVTNRAWSGLLKGLGARNVSEYVIHLERVGD